MATMNVSMSKEMADFVEREVASGEYSSSSEVVREALRLLRHDKEQQQEKLAILRREIDIGLEAMRSGRVSKKTIAEIAEEVIREVPDNEV